MINAAVRTHKEQNMMQKKARLKKTTRSPEGDIEELIDQSIRVLLKDYGGKVLFIEGTQGFLKGEVLNAAALGNRALSFATLNDPERGVIKVSLETISRIRHEDRILWDYTEERERFQKIREHLHAQHTQTKKEPAMASTTPHKKTPQIPSPKPKQQKKVQAQSLPEPLDQKAPENREVRAKASPAPLPHPSKEPLKEEDVSPKEVPRERKNPRKINKTFSLTPEAVTFLDTVERKSTFMNEIITGYEHGRFIREETAQLLKKHQSLFGVDPEDALHKILLKKIQKIESNMKSLKDTAPAELKNKVGGAFLKLNRAYEALVAENKESARKQAITFGLLFKKTGCNHQSIRGWIRANKEGLAAYHQSMGIHDPAIHNRQMGVIKRVERIKKTREETSHV